LKHCLAYGISSVWNSCRYLSPLTEFCSTTKSVFLPWWILPQTWTEPPPAMTVPTTQSAWNVHLAVASHRLFHQSDEAKTIETILLCPQKPSLFVQIIKQRSLNGSACLKAPAEQTSVYSCSWKSNINSVLPQLSENWCWFHSVTSTNAIQNAIISCWRLSWPTRWCLRLNSTSLRVTSEDFGHSTLAYVEVTGNIILSELGTAQTYYLPSYALWNSWWHWPLYLGTAG
jgi:hypothetical protein